MKSSPDLSGATIVVGEDDAIMRGKLHEMVTRSGFVSEPFESGQQVLDRVSQGGVDLVLLDVVMPGMNGLQTCRLVKGLVPDRFLPVILLTSRDAPASRVEGLRQGADDYVCKPFVEQELLARIDAMLRIKRLHDGVARENEALAESNVVDSLTGLYNYKYLQQRLNQEFKRAERQREPLACVIVHVDRLEHLRLVGGQSFGDSVLKSVAGIITRSVRAVDTAIRFGGDEFLILMPDARLSDSADLGEKLCAAVRARTFVADVSKRVTATVSVGAAVYPSRFVATGADLSQAAQTAVMQARDDGGDCVSLFSQGLVSIEPTSMAPGDPNRGAS